MLNYKEANYDPETKFLVDGFTNGFDIGYRGNKIRQSHSKSLLSLLGTNMNYGIKS